MSYTISPLLALLLLALSGPSARADVAAGAVTGTVSVPGGDGQALDMPGVTLTLACDGSQQPIAEVSDDQGHFRFGQAPAGNCSIAAELQGFKPTVKTILIKPGEAVDVTLNLELESVHEEVVVKATPPLTERAPIDTHVSTIHTETLQNAPLANERVQDALPLIPGVVRGPDGLLNIGGARSNQSAVRFNNANGTDPVTGEDAIELPIDAVSSVDVQGAAFAPEYGLSAGAVTSISTQNGGDRWHTIINDLEPRPRIRDGQLHGLESWTPRATVGGPVVKGKFNLLQAVQFEYSQTQTFDLPPLESDTKVESVESYTRGDWTVSSRNHFTGSVLAAPRKTTYAGLSPFTPQPVTPNIKKHVLMGTASDQLIVGSQGVLDTMASVKVFDATIYPAVGNGPMILAPEQNAGSHFNSQDGTSHRAELLTTYAFAPLGPAHLVKVGGGVTYETLGGASTSRPVEIVREDRTLSSLTTFSGSGRVDRNRTAASGFAQDTWTVSNRLTVLYGVRSDYDSIAGAVDVAPRGSVTASLTSDGRTMLHGGAGLFYTPVPLNVSVFSQLQQRTIVEYQPDGITPDGPALTFANLAPWGLHTPRSVNLTVELDRELIKNLDVRFTAQQRKTSDEPIVDVVPASLLLRTNGESRYREAQVTARYQLRGKDQIVGSYTRSSAVGDLNEFNSYFGPIQNPVIRANERGPLPWDAPNHWLFWSTVTLPKGFTVFPVLDVRTGFPYSTFDEDRNFVGARNQAGRYPTFVSLDGQITKRLRVFHHNATIGVKVFNITDHHNPRDFQGNIDASDFGHFYNSVGRTFRGKWVFEF